MLYVDSKIGFLGSLFLPYSDPRHLTLNRFLLNILPLLSFLCSFIGPLELMEASEHGGCSTPGCKGIGHFKRARHLGPHRYVVAVTDVVKYRVPVPYTCIYNEFHVY